MTLREKHCGPARENAPFVDCEFHRGNARDRARGDRRDSRARVMSMSLTIFLFEAELVRTTLSFISIIMWYFELFRVILLGIKNSIPRIKSFYLGLKTRGFYKQYIRSCIKKK